HSHLMALVMLIAKQTREPLNIYQFTRRACAALAFNANWQALQAQGWGDAQLAALAAAWQPCDFVKDMAFAMELELGMTLDLFKQIRDSRRKLDFVIQQRQKSEEMLDGAFGALPTQGFI